ncbi:hypothetical protein [Dendronalium sp. ChiSLP03b]|uniref:hypothetical protein n=1 Tax=Dendronalium sp. ChiSLP03b TaxID=3075381 RepID=UPI003919272D
MLGKLLCSYSKKNQTFGSYHLFFTVGREEGKKRFSFSTSAACQAFKEVRINWVVTSPRLSQ